MHSINVCILSIAFGRYLGFSVNLLKILGIGALMHDIGKVKVPDSILKKPGGLTGKEFMIMKNHVSEGTKILTNTQGIPTKSIEIAAQHHERQDGSGYLYGLKKEQIGVLGNISAIIDVYDAITSDRVYHEAITAHKALRIMFECKGKDFNSVLFDKFVHCVGIYPIGTLVELTSLQIGMVISVNKNNILKPKVLLLQNQHKERYQTTRIIDLSQHACDIKKVVHPTSHYKMTAKEIMKKNGWLY